MDAIEARAPVGVIFDYKDLFRDLKPLRDFYKGKKNGIEKWSKSFKDRTEWLSGWAHDFLDESGKAILWDTNIHVRPINAANEKTFGAWVFYARKLNLVMIRDAALIDYFEGSSINRAWAIEQLKFYANSYCKWPLRLKSGTSRMFLQSIDEAHAAHFIIEAISALEGNPGDIEDIRFVKEQLLLPMYKNLQLSRSDIFNIDLEVLSASVVLEKFLFGNPKISTVESILLKYANPHDWRLADGSVGYEIEAVKAMARVVSAVQEKVTNDLIFDVKTLHINRLSAMFELSLDDSRLPMFGDTIGERYLIRCSIGFNKVVLALHKPAKCTDQDFARALWSGDVLFFEKDLSPKSKGGARSSSFFYSDISKIHSANWSVLIKHSRGEKSHIHRDYGQTEIALNNVPIAMDFGTVSYGARLHREFFATQRAHNFVFQKNVISNWVTELVSILSPEQGTPEKMFSLRSHNDSGFAAEMLIKIESDARLIRSTTVSSPGASALARGKITHPFFFMCGIEGLSSLCKTSKTGLEEALLTLQSRGEYFLVCQKNDIVRMRLRCGTQRVLASFKSSTNGGYQLVGNLDSIISKKAAYVEFQSFENTRGTYTMELVGQ